MKRYIILLILISLCLISAHQPYPFYTSSVTSQEQWVDSVYTEMSAKERIAQLFIVKVHADQGLKHENQTKLLIMNQHIGGVQFAAGFPVKQATLTNAYQQLSKTPLWIALDDYSGEAKDSLFSLPDNITLGALQNDSIVQKLANRFGERYKKLGIHIAMRPMTRIQTTNNALRIGNHAFGESHAWATKNAIALTNGIQSHNIIAVAQEHAPKQTVMQYILDDISTDAQLVDETDSLRYFPHNHLIREKIGGFMMHTEEDASANMQEINVLRNQFGFSGLFFTEIYPSETQLMEDQSLSAFLAGNDVLIVSGHIPEHIAKFENALAENIITETRLENSVKNILRAKYKQKIHEFQPIATDSLAKRIFTPQDKILYNNTYKKAITAVKTSGNMLPVSNLEKRNIAYISMGKGNGNQYLQMLRNYAKVTVITAENLPDLLQKLKPFDTVMIGFHAPENTLGEFMHFTDKEIVWLQEIARKHQVVLNIFGNPYALEKVKSFTNIENIIVSYENNPTAQEISAQILFGILPSGGKLPVAVKETFAFGSGEETAILPRLGYDIPETVGMNSDKLMKIDSLAQLVVSEKMAPGLQLLVARKGKIIYHKTFGYHTYDEKQKVHFNDVYDVASMTKILATLPMVMRMEEERTIALTSKLGTLLPEFKDSNKKNLTVIEILSHYARLTPWIPFYTSTLDSVTKLPSNEWYSDSLSKEYSVKVADNLYMKAAYKDSMMQRIIDSDLLKRKRYKYSDLPFYILKDFIEDAYQKDLNELTQNYYYASLGAHRTTYNPLKKISKNMIVPSEIDDYYRNQTLQGYVHDMGAAMQGGIGGHAGLFSNANDVAKIMQMYLQGGTYGDHQYLKAKTIDKFNTCFYCDKDVRRGVGFDKPQLGNVGPTCGCVSMKSFGHSGFTGTYTWADPDEEIVYVFLSNRTYPTMSNRKLIQSNIRTKIQALIYEAIEE